MLIVLDHAAADGTGLDIPDKLHRINPEIVKQEVTAAGFVYEGESTVLRNPEFARTLEILREACGPERLITFARAVTTPEECIETVTLAEARPEMADMALIVETPGEAAGQAKDIQMLRELAPLGPG